MRGMLREEYNNSNNLRQGPLRSAKSMRCPGCGGPDSLKHSFFNNRESSVFRNASGCRTFLSVDPFMPIRTSWMSESLTFAPAGAQGVRDAIDILIAKKRIAASKKNIRIMVLTGDGSAAGAGLSSASASIDRKLDFLYICYDGDAYGNMGCQYFSKEAQKTNKYLSPGNVGYADMRKDLFDIWVSHKPAYAATVTGAEPIDFARKLERAINMKGSRLIMVFSPCPVRWKCKADQILNIGKLAVRTGIWPLKEYIDGKIIHNMIPERRKPVEDYLELQGRFRHLFAPNRQNGMIEEIQNRVDHYWTMISSPEAGSI